MRATATVTAGRWTRLLLVVATLFGLAVMHTLGHGTHAGGHEPVASAHDATSAHEGAITASAQDGALVASAHEGTVAASAQDGALVASAHEGAITASAHEGAVAARVRESMAAAPAGAGTVASSVHGATGVAALGRAVRPPGPMVGEHDVAPAVRLVAAVVPLGAGCPPGCPHERLLAAGGTGGGFPDWGVCLAVLGAFGVSLLLAVLLRTVAEVAGSDGRSGDRSPGASRAPPPRPVGLRLATVSVLRR